jgi:hypothetical protein
MEISRAKQGDPPIGASTTFLFLDREIVPLIRFGSLNRGLQFGVSELARVKTKIAALDSTTIPGAGTPRLTMPIQHFLLIF